MKTKRFIWTVLCPLMVLSLALGACAPVVQTKVVKETQVIKETQIVQQEVVITATPPPFKPAGTLTVGLTTAVTSIEMPYAPERQSANASWTMFDSLLYPTGAGELEGALAERWEVSEDGTEYTFYLRQGVTFHDGSTFNADSVVFTWETYKQPDVTYASDFYSAESVVKVDDYTVKVKTPTANSQFPASVAWRWTMIPVNWGGKTKEEFANHPIGTGPFMFEEWVKGDHLTVAANPNYWRPTHPKLERVVFRFLPEAATRLAAVQTGEIDLAPRLSADLAQTLLGQPNINIVKYPTTRLFYLAYNNVSTGIDTPIANAQVRQALAHAVDLQTIIDTLFDGYGVQAVGLVGQGELGFDNAEPPAYDPELTKQMLAEAGYPAGFDIGMACPDGGYTNINEVCQAIQGYLGEVGINVDLAMMESNAYWDMEAKQQLPPLFVDGWSVNTPEAWYRLQGSLGKGESYAAWYDEKLAGLITGAGQEVDPEKRAALYGEIQTLMREDPPFMYLYQIEAFEAVSSRVQNYQPGNAENYFLWDVFVSD